MSSNVSEFESLYRATICDPNETNIKTLFSSFRAETKVFSKC